MGTKKAIFEAACAASLPAVLVFVLLSTAAFFKNPKIGNAASFEGKQIGLKTKDYGDFEAGLNFSKAISRGFGGFYFTVAATCQANKGNVFHWA
jgi:hypothetical protein